MKEPNQNFEETVSKIIKHKLYKNYENYQTDNRRNFVIIFEQKFVWYILYYFWYFVAVLKVLQVLQLIEKKIML